MDFSKHYKTYLILPAILSLLSLVAILGWGLKPGIDLVGGSLMQVTYPRNRPDTPVVENALKHLQFGEVRVQAAGENDYIIRMPALSAPERDAAESALG